MHSEAPRQRRDNQHKKEKEQSCRKWPITKGHYIENDRDREYGHATQEFGI